jgi:hypothetical protein
MKVTLREATGRASGRRSAEDATESDDDAKTDVN